MANINETNAFRFRLSQRVGEDVAFSYNAKSDGHERVVVGRVENVTSYHVTILDRVRDGAPRVFILDRIRGEVVRLR